MFSTDHNESSGAARHRGRTPNEKRAAPPDSVDRGVKPENWEDEIRLNHLLGGLPDAPISSNFTARVLRRAEREIQTRPRHSWRARWESFVGTFSSLSWTSRLAVGGALLCVSILSVHQYRISARQEVARSVAEVSGIAALPVDALMNFEAIKRLPEIPKSRQVDVELLAALK